MKTNKSNIEYGEKDLIVGDLDYKDAKIKVSMLLDGDVLQAVKAYAKENHQKYQTLINQTLRDTFVSSHKIEKVEMATILSQLNKLSERIKKLEKKRTA